MKRKITGYMYVYIYICMYIYITCVVLVIFSVGILFYSATTLGFVAMLALFGEWFHRPYVG